MASKAMVGLLAARIASCAQASTSGGMHAAATSVLAPSAAAAAASSGWWPSPGWGAAAAAVRAMGTGSSSVAAAARQTPQAAEHVSPQDVARELQAIEAHLRRGSSIDGTKRVQFATADLPFPMPAHPIEDGLPVVKAYVRTRSGQVFNKWLRKEKRMPGCISSLPDNGLVLVTLPQGEGERLLQLYGRNGCLARVLRMELLSPDDLGKVLAAVRVKPQRVHVNAATQRLENIDFLYCPQDRIVTVDVPIRLVNDDVAPGIKKGGWMSMSQRTARYQCLGSSVPPAVELDVRGLELEQARLVRHLPIPQGTRMSAQNYDAVVVRCTTDVGKE